MTYTEFECRSMLLTKAQASLLISLLHAEGSVPHKIPPGANWFNGRMYKMLVRLREQGFIEWDYVKLYTTRNLFQASLTEDGYRAAVRLSYLRGLYGEGTNKIHTMPWEWKRS